MRINTNAVGNYFQQQTRNVSNVARQESVQKTTTKNLVEQPISGKEKEMFAKMYPQQKSEIMEYHYYQKNGVMSGVTVGSLLDRRG
jgi:predicted choloylglycine hydrolase